MTLHWRLGGNTVKTSQRGGNTVETTGNSMAKQWQTVAMYWRQVTTQLQHDGNLAM